MKWTERHEKPAKYDWTEHAERNADLQRGEIRSEASRRGS